MTKTELLSSLPLLAFINNFTIIKSIKLMKKKFVSEIAKKM